MARIKSDLGFGLELAETRELIERSQRLLGHLHLANPEYADQVRKSRAAIADSRERFNLSGPTLQRLRAMVDESRLQMAKRHVAEQEGRVARQEKLIERLSEQGLSTKQAEDLLEEMVTMLDDMRAELTRFEPAQKRTKPGPDR